MSRARGAIIGGVLPIVTPAEMAAIDAAASEPVTELISRAGHAVAREALQLMGGAYGRRVVVIAGKGNNGADGREAARRLCRRGVRVSVIEAAAAPVAIDGPCDLVIDAAYGTGFRGEYRAPDPAGAPVLAVDIPSGVSGLTGEACVGAVRADRTITFAALKPGLVLGEGRALSGDVRVADIGLDTSGATTHLVDDAGVAAWLPSRPLHAHKWQAAVWIVAGSPGMTGAAVLAARGAQRADAGYVRLSVPGAGSSLELVAKPAEVVTTELDGEGWAATVLDGLGRFEAMVVGPGLGADASAAVEVRALVAGAAVPVVVDGDGLTALGHEVATFASSGTILTPHEGEYERLTGAAPPPDRLGAVAALARTTGAVVLLKGSTTVVADAGGTAYVVTAGDARLATAGTGDVLSGIIAALCAGGLDPLRAAAAGAHLHGRAGHLGWRRGLVAGDLPDLVPQVMASLRP